jgi:hypothetical protein
MTKGIGWLAAIVAQHAGGKTMPGPSAGEAMGCSPFRMDRPFLMLDVS